MVITLTSAFIVAGPGEGADNPSGPETDIALLVGI
jgi:hypothetical protein